MALRVGIDLVAVAAVHDALMSSADRYLERIYSVDEVRDCETQDGVAAERLAARFAAKEATLKVLRPGRDTAVPLRSIEVVRGSEGAVELALSGRAAELAERSGLGGFAVSLSHDAGFATAVVVAELT